MRTPLIVVKRREDWVTRFLECVDKFADVKMQYGSFDCCLGGVALVEAMTGVDLAADFRGYNQRKKAYSRIARFGGLLGAVEEVARQHDIPEIPVTHAQRGDVLVVELALGKALAVVDLTGQGVLIPYGRGFRRLPFEAVSLIKAWRIS